MLCNDGTDIVNSKLLTLTNSIEHSSSWEAKISSASQEIPRILWNPKVHYRSSNIKPPVPVPSRISPVHAPYYISSRPILLLPYHLRLGLPSCLFPSHLPTKIQYALLLSPICSTYPVHLNLLDVIPKQYIVSYTDHYPFKDEAQTALFKDPVRTAL